MSKKVALNQQLNILSRPKRSSHFTKFDNLPPDVLKQLASVSDDESDDEEYFVPTTTKEKKKLKSTPISATKTDDDNDNDSCSSTEISSTNSTSNSSSSSSEEEDEKVKEEEEKSEFAQLEEPKKNRKTKTQNGNGNGIIKKIKKQATGNNKNGTKKTPTKKKRRVGRTTRGYESDDAATQKIINSFQIATIKKAKVTSTNTNNNKRSGPSLRCVRKEDEFLTYEVISNEKNINNLKTYINNETNNNNNKNKNQQLQSTTRKTRIPTKDKPYPVLDKTSRWECSLCHMGPNETSDGLEEDLLGPGELFGPYRIRNESTSKKNENEQEKNEVLEEKEKVREVWLHEACAVWSPGIHVKNNRIYGIETLIRSAAQKKCAICKKTGASLICSASKSNNKMCEKAFHYPCARKAKCSFNAENFSMHCKLCLD